MSKRVVKSNSVPFIIITKNGLYTLDNVYLEKFFGSVSIAGNGPNIKECTILEGDYEMLVKVLKFVQDKVKENVGVKSQCVIDLRDLYDVDKN